MDINEKLDQIIFKYHLDQYYPHYRNMCEAKKVLKGIISDIIKKNQKVLFVGDDKTGLNFIQNMSRDYINIHFCLYDRLDLTFHKLEAVNWKEYEDIYLISYYNVEFVERWFRQRKVKYKWIYDIFEQFKLVLQNEFFAFGKADLLPLIPNYRHTNKRWTETIQCYLYCEQSKLKDTSNSSIRHMRLEKCLFLSLYIRNFIEAQKYVEQLSGEDEQYERLWKEILDLLNEAKEIIRKRQKKDIVLFWMDALAYGDEKNMSYLRGIMEKSIVFENAISHTGYTHSEIRALFLGKREIDDHAYRTLKITRENSPIIQMLEEQGYDIKISSGVFNDSFSFQYLSEQFFSDLYTPGSMMLWDMLSHMVAEEKKIFYIVHIMDTHDPYLGGEWYNDIYRTTYDWKEKQYMLSKQETDKLLAFYDMFKNENAYYIYMSDHGKDPAAKRHHALFNVYHRNLHPKRITGIFSSLDFGIVLKQIIMDGSIKEQEFLREYAEIIRADRYNFENIRSILKGEGPLTMYYFGAKGIVDENYIYFHYKTGKEWLQKRENIPLCNPLLFYDCEDDICDTGLLPRYRELAGTYPEDVIKDEKFKYSKYLYYLYYNLLKYNNVGECVKMINFLLKDYSNNSIAIRMGGEHSVVFYYILSEENKKKIWGFIDENSACLCCKYGLPVIGTKNMKELEAIGIKAVLLSSYKNLNFLREESKILSDNIDVLDIYDYFEKNGIKCKREFYEVTGMKEDYDVGFPFEKDNG